MNYKSSYKNLIKSMYEADPTRTLNILESEDNVTSLDFTLLSKVGNFRITSFYIEVMSEVDYKKVVGKHLLNKYYNSWKRIHDDLTAQYELLWTGGRMRDETTSIKGSDNSTTTGNNKHKVSGFNSTESVDQSEDISDINGSSTNSKDRVNHLEEKTNSVTYTHAEVIEKDLSLYLETHLFDIIVADIQKEMCLQISDTGEYSVNVPSGGEGGGEVPSDLAEKVKANTTAINLLDNRFDDHEIEYKALKQNVLDNSNSIITNKADSDKSIKQLLEELAGTNLSVGELDKRIDETNNSILSVSSEIDKVNSRVDEHERRLDTTDTNIYDINTALDAITPRVDTLEITTTTLSETLGGLNDFADAIDVKATANANDITDITTRVDKLENNDYLSIGKYTDVGTTKVVQGILLDDFYNFVDKPDSLILRVNFPHTCESYEIICGTDNEGFIHAQARIITPVRSDTLTPMLKNIKIDTAKFYIYLNCVANAQFNISWVVADPRFDPSKVTYNSLTSFPNVALEDVNIIGNLFGTQGTSVQGTKIILR